MTYKTFLLALKAIDYDNEESCQIISDIVHSKFFPGRESITFAANYCQFYERIEEIAEKSPQKAYEYSLFFDREHDTAEFCRRKAKKGAK